MQLKHHLYSPCPACRPPTLFGSADTVARLCVCLPPCRVRALSLLGLLFAWPTYTAAYPNWTSSVKVPFPVQCAGKLANLMEKKDLRDVEVHRSLRKGYFYL